MDAVPTTITVGSDYPTITYGPAGFQGLIKQPYVFALACFASLGGLLFGYDQGVISGVLVMNNFAGWSRSHVRRFHQRTHFGKTFSRKRSILYANFVFLIGSLLQAAAQNVSMIFHRKVFFFAGVSIGMLAMVTPLHLSELSPPEIRGALVTLQYEVAWRLPLALQCLPSVVLAIGTFFLPFSPRWLVNQGREKEAFETLVKLRRVPEDDPRLGREIFEIRVAYVFEQESLKAKYGDGASKFEIALQQYMELFTIGHLRKRTIIARGLQVVEQFTGINAIIYYAPTIFKALSLSSTSITLSATGVVGIINVLFTIPSLYFIDRVGRRKLLIIGAIGMSIAQLIVGSLFAAFKDSWSTHRAAGWVACTFVWIYIAFFAFQVGVIWIMPSEMMLRKIRFGTFYFFLVFCVILLGWSWWGIPETKVGVPIEEMDKIFGENEGEEDVRRMELIRTRLERQDGVVEQVVIAEVKGKE
ncbi:uncharacterized protein MYCFIDRAFT_205173 [Pseudocercospora fijiensis CIRAD86]|uniref:Major facilitator superfamily (MFS) profile domain-containing protein n=1 Tax=Pseudocercospora fijiensis (strain CIRAD86) TaxID=383855 RepID=M3A2W0_PSEFD|nr:uncharacterized protein MYCFIDRAFT_205173 [Pseudocercospora fijiensis CIRAD86]EME78776.1 hypothetical protein MYCFIDRAFT_205173 [Pseudocercospora fijiensis CIRAD86]